MVEHRHVLAVAFAASWLAGCAGCGEDEGSARERPTCAPAVPSAPVVAAEAAHRPPELVQKDQVEILSVAGTVQRGTASNEWSPVRPGDRLFEHEQIRNVGDGPALLLLGRAARVELSPGSQLSVPEISISLARVKLTEGRLSAVVTGDGSAVVRVEVPGVESVAESTTGEFAVLTNGRGRMTVASTRGEVKVGSRAATVIVPAGKQTLVEARQPPLPPSPIPPSLYLKVGTPTSLVQRERTTTIAGQVSPGAVVSVNGVRVLTAESGSFAAVVTLAAGPNAIEVKATDVAGRQESVRLPTLVVKQQVEVKSRVRWISRGADP